jgi:ribonuclease VapC
VTSSFVVDSSAIVAILNQEVQADHFLSILSLQQRLIGWPTIFETRIWTIRNRPDAQNPWLDIFIDSELTRAIAFDGQLEKLSARAYQQFGKGRHPAQLNYGDCMAYAVARQHDVPLLFKGADFAQTDVKVHPNSVVII